MFGVVEDLTQTVDKIIASESPLDIVQLRKQIERLEFAWLRAVRDAERSCEWADDGFATCGAWLRDKCKLSPSAATASVKLARTLESLPATSDAFAAGEITRKHVEVMAKPALAEVEERLVDVAKQVTPVELRNVVQRLTDAIDGDDGAARANAQYNAEYMHASPTLDGMVRIDGVLSPERGEIVLSAFDASMEANRTSVTQRTRSQRRADAFVELVQAGAAHILDGPGRRTRPQVSIVVDLELLEARGADDLVRAVKGEAEHVGALSKATLQRLTCDCAIARVITQGGSMALDVGRSTRTIPPAIWRALVARDGGCTHPGCDRPPGWTEAHHIVHWENGGETKLPNLTLLCWRHHRAVHEGGECSRGSPNSCEA